MAGDPVRPNELASIIADDIAQDDGILIKDTDVGASGQLKSISIEEFNKIYLHEGGIYYGADENNPQENDWKTIRNGIFKESSRYNGTEWERFTTEGGSLNTDNLLLDHAGAINSVGDNHRSVNYISETADHGIIVGDVIVDTKINTKNELILGTEGARTNYTSHEFESETLISDTLVFDIIAVADAVIDKLTYFLQPEDVGAGMSLTMYEYLDEGGEKRTYKSFPDIANLLPYSVEIDNLYETVVGPTIRLELGIKYRFEARFYEPGQGELTPRDVHIKGITAPHPWTPASFQFVPKFTDHAYLEVNKVAATQDWVLESTASIMKYKEGITVANFNALALADIGDVYMILDAGTLVNGTITDDIYNYTVVFKNNITSIVTASDFDVFATKTNPTLIKSPDQTMSLQVTDDIIRGYTNTNQVRIEISDSLSEFRDNISGASFGCFKLFNNSLLYHDGTRIRTRIDGSGQSLTSPDGVKTLTLNNSGVSVGGSLTTTDNITCNGIANLDQLRVGNNDSGDDDYIYFDATSEYLRWENSNGRFGLSDNLNVVGSINSTSTITASSTINVGNNFLASDQLYRTDGGALHLNWSGSGATNIGNTSGNVQINAKVGIGIAPHSSYSTTVKCKGTTAFLGGLAIEHYTDTDKWSFGYWTATGDNDLSLAFNGSVKNYVRDTDGVWSNGSDSRFKKNITELGSVINRVMALKPSEFNMLEDSDDTPKRIGFIAQEVESYFPSTVTTKENTTNSEDRKFLAYQDFSVLAIKAIQEQQEIIDSLLSRVSALEAL